VAQQWRQHIPLAEMGPPSTSAILLTLHLDRFHDDLDGEGVIRYTFGEFSNLSGPNLSESLIFLFSVCGASKGSGLLC
jgi:hypothetical protein